MSITNSRGRSCPNTMCASVARKHQPKMFTTRRVVDQGLTMWKRGLRYVAHVTKRYMPTLTKHGKMDG